MAGRWRSAAGALTTTCSRSSRICETRRRAEVDYWPADVGVAADRSRLLDAVEARFGRLDALVNNAGKAPERARGSARGDRGQLRGPDSHEPAGPLFPDATGGAAAGRSRAALPASSAAATAAGIVFVTSVSAELASPNRGEYCVSKAGLAMAAQLFALRLAPAGIPVYEVRPGRHRDRHDGQGERSLRPAHRRRTGARRALGLSRGRRARRSPRCCAATCRTRRGR